MFFTPSCLAEALEMLANHPTAMPLAGGTDLLVRLRREDHPRKPDLLSLHRIEELRRISEEEDFLAIGAACSFAAIIADPLVKRYASLLVRAARTIGGPAIRNMATLGGNVCTASPAGDSLPPLYLLEARIELASQAGRRVLPVTDFILGPGKTCHAPGEVVTRILVPKAVPCPHERFIKVGGRKALAISVISFAAMAWLGADGRLAALRLAWGSVGQTVVRLPDLEQELVGNTITPLIIELARRRAGQGISPISDLRASAEYRRFVAANLLAEFLESL